MKMPDGGEETIREKIDKLWKEHDAEETGSLNRLGSNKIIKECLSSLGINDDF
jgi:hypothetical protein